MPIEIWIMILGGLGVIFFSVIFGGKK